MCAEQNFVRSAALGCIKVPSGASKSEIPAWNPQAQRERYERLCNSALSAAHLAEDIATVFPPPWEPENSEIGTLVTKLVEFVSGTLQATTLPVKQISATQASILVRRVKPIATSKTRRMPPWELLLDLVRVASKEKCDPSERTLRRYVDEQSRLKVPVYLHWKRNWDLIRRVNRLAPVRPDTEQFERAARQHLEGPS